MAVNNIPVLKPAPNHDYLNLIRESTSPHYQHEVPLADQANMDQVARQLRNNVALFNEAFDALINKVGKTIIQNALWTNPFAEFKKGELPYGSIVEEIGTDWTETHQYDPDREVMERTLFGTHNVGVQSSYHTITRQDRYDITVNMPMMQRAFTSSDGLHKLVTGIMTAPTNKANWDEFIQMTHLFSLYEQLGGFYKINVPNLRTLESNQNDARKTLRIMRSWGENLRFPSRLYNAANLPSFADTKDLVLFTTPEFRAAVDVDALAAAFNIDRANIPFRIVVIPREYFPNEKIQAILTTKDFFQVYDTYLGTESMRNPGALQTNHFMHVHQIISASRMVPAVAFWTGPETVVKKTSYKPASVTGIVVTNFDGQALTLATDKVAQGKTYSLSATVTTTPTGGEGTIALDWGLTGNKQPRTRVTDNGVLHVDVEESAATLSITATAVNDRSKTATVSVNVKTLGATIWPRQDHIDGDGDGIPDETDPDVDGDGTPNKTDADPSDPNIS